MADLIKQLLDQIETGRPEDALRTIELLNFHSSDPAICNRHTLDALQKARTLAVIHRSHLLRRLRSLQASRLFQPQSESNSATWQIDG